MNTPPKCRLHQCTLNSAPVCKVSWCKVHNSSHSFIRGQKLSPVIAHPSLKASRDKKVLKGIFFRSLCMQCYKSLSNSYNHSLGVLVLLNSCIARHTKWFQETEMEIQKQIQIQVGQSAGKEEEQKRQRLNMSEIRGSKGSRTETQEGPQVRGRPKEFCSNTETWSSDNLKPELPKIYPKACQSTPTA